MAEIHPFRGIRYNQKLVKDLAAVICPPYDVITPEQQKTYYQRSDYNVIRLEHGMKLPQDTADNNKHTRTAVTFRQWLEEGILQTDVAPSFYLHDHYFTYQGTGRRRQGLVACVRLEPPGSKVVRPHENTVAGIKSDRLELMRTCGANFSPIFAFYQEREQKTARRLASETKHEPLIDFTDIGGDRHILWAITEPGVIDRLSLAFIGQPLYIADGHHRYETAVSYQQERQWGSSAITGKEAFNFVMMTLVSFSDPGLIILPLHRLVRGTSPSVLAGLKNQLETFFDIQSFPWSQFELPQGEVVFGVLGLEPERVLVLRLRQAVSLDGIMPEHRCQVYKKLGVSLVHHLVIDKLIGPLTEGGIGYTQDVTEAWQQVQSNQYQLAFLLNPVSVATIKAIADADDVMPGKSTYFYPKLPTGLVINKLEGELY